MPSNLEIHNAKPQDKDYSINIGTGLSVLVKATGSKLWRFRYSFAGKRCIVSLGKYPHVSIKQAKIKQREYMDMLDKGINPATHKHIKKIKLATEQNFKTIALQWHSKQYKNSNVRHAKLILQRLEKYIFPLIGKIPLKDIEAPMLFNIIEKIQDKGFIETGKRVNSYCSMTFRYGVAKGHCLRDITQDYKGMLKSAKPKNMPTLTSTEEITELLQDMHNYHGTTIVKTALVISAYVFVRPSELACSRWDYIDFDQCHWLIPAKHMKMKRDHLIPFPKQVRKLLTALHPITGESEYIFPNERNYNKPMHSETVNKTLRRIQNGKYINRMVSHGFRGMASTILNEHKFRAEIIEKQLAHQERNQVRGAYNHAEYLPERTQMMQWYADYLDGLTE
jgi:integrase